MQIVHMIILMGEKMFLILFVMLMSKSEKYVWYATVWRSDQSVKNRVAKAPIRFNGNPPKCPFTLQICVSWISQGI